MFRDARGMLNSMGAGSSRHCDKVIGEDQGSKDDLVNVTDITITPMVRDFIYKINIRE